MTKLPRYNNKKRKYDRNYSNIILAKTISSNLNFNGRTFFNVNFRGARLRKIKFNSCEFVLCDFSGTILNKGKFTNVIFKKCIFFAAILRDSKFKDCKFKNCFFINMNKEMLSGCEIIDCFNYSYYDLTVPLESNDDLEFTRKYHIFKKNRLLHIKGGKINRATIFIIMKYLKYDILVKNLKILCENGTLKKVYTTMRLLEVLLKKDY